MKSPSANTPDSSPLASEPRKTSRDFHPEVLRLFDAYVHGALDRRGFIERAAKFAVGGATALGLLEALSPKFAEAQQIRPSDTRLKSEYIEIDSPRGHGKVRGYLTRLAKPTGKLPLVLVVHENRGLNPHIEDVARRVALEKFIAFAPDALFPLGGYPGDEDKARELFAQLDQVKTREDFIASAAFLKRMPQGNTKVGVVGFCYGGGIAHFLSTRLPNLGAAVPFYGMSPAPDQAAAVRCPLQVHLAERDERINGAWPAYEAALKAAKIKFEVHHYPGTEHGFHNDTTPRYDETAAKLAWTRTLALFNSTLRTSPSATMPAKRPVKPAK